MDLTVSPKFYCRRDRISIGEDFYGVDPCWLWKYLSTWKEGKLGDWRRYLSWSKGPGLYHFDLVLLEKKTLTGFSPKRGVFP